MSQAGGQAPQGGAGAGQSAAQNVWLKPEQIRSTPLLTEVEKTDYEATLKQLTEGTPLDRSAKTQEEKDKQVKLAEYTNMIRKKMRDRKVAYESRLAAQQQAQLAKQQAASGGSAPAGAQTNQAAAAAGGQVAGQANAGAGAAQAAASAATGAAAGQAAQQPKPIPPHILAHVTQMTYFPPPAIADKGTEVIRKWQQESKSRLVKALTHMESMRGQVARLDEQLKERTEKGRPLTADEQKIFNERKGSLLKGYQEAERFAKQFREQQETLKAQRAQAQANGGNAAGAAANQPTQARPQPAQIATAGAARAGNASSPNSGLQTSPNAMNNQVNAAFEAAKKQQLAAGKVQGMNNAVSGVSQQPGAQGNGAQNLNSVAPHLGMGGQPGQHLQQGQPHPGIKMEPGTRGPPHPAPINTQLATAQGLPTTGTPTQGSARLQTPQSAVPPPVRPLTHGAAMSMANARLSQPNSAVPGQPATGGTPASAAGFAGVNPAQVHTQHPGQTPPGQTIQSKMPIGKNLPERTLGTPQPVNLGGGVNPGRPTMSGGGGVAGGVMGQPVISRMPGFSLESEGERVLNKKKLDELVRQVCGGASEGQESSLLAPEVEEVGLS
jgi:transcription initiation factor TFIID subunit 12